MKVWTASDRQILTYICAIGESKDEHNTVWSINDLRGKVSLKIGNNVTGVRSCDDTRREDVVRLALLVLRELRLLGGDWGSEAEEGVHYCFRVGAVWHKVRGVRQRGTKNGLVSLTTCGDLPLSLG